MNSYQVVYNSIMLAMDKRDVAQAFSRLFKLSPEKAAAILDKPGTVLRSNLDSATAEMYREKLMTIGLDVEVHDASMQKPPVLPENQAAVVHVPTPVLELAPIEKQASDDIGSVAGYRGNRILDFEFSGSGRGYFRIWIVNVFLTVLTLGIYSAWATVRRQQYFYSNTRLDNAPFRYLAAPVQVLRWRIAGVALLVLYVFLLKLVSTTAATLFLLLLLLVLPVLVVMALTGYLRAIAWRNVAFDLPRDVAAVYKIAWMPILVLAGVVAMPREFFSAGLLVLSLGFPYWQFSLNRFLVSRTAYGGECFHFAARAGDYYKLYFLKVPVLLLLLVLLVGGVLFVAMGQGAAEQWLALHALWRPSSSGASVVIKPGTYAAVLSVVIGVGWLAAYIRAGLFNLRYDGLVLGKSQLSCQMRTLPLLWLYLSNALAILLSAGLFVPWARVRMVRYCLSALTLHASYELDDIVGKALRGDATSDEISELFYVDIAP